MIPKEIKASPIFGEFTPEEQDRYFDLRREKVCAHVDTFYYTVSLFNDGNDPPAGVVELLEDLQDEKFKTSESEFYGLSMQKTKFVHYEFCLRREEEFDIFIASFLPNIFTPRIVVQLRSRLLVQAGTCQAICKSFSYLETILKAYGLQVSEIKENRIDYAYHTNIVQNPYKFFNDRRLLGHLKSKLRIYHKVGEIGGSSIDIDYISFGNRKSNDIFVRIYNKSREVIEKNYKAFFIDKWLRDKLINSYDHYVYTKAYELKSYVTGILIGRLEWYLEYGSNESIKDELRAARDSSYIRSDNTDELREKVDKYLPPVTLIMNIEYQTKRRFYSTLNDWLEMYQQPYFENGEFMGFYEKGEIPLFRLFSILGQRADICNYLTTTTLSFVDKKGTKEEKLMYFWRRINECYIEEYDKRIIDLWRSHEHHADIEKTKRKVYGTVASISILQNNGFKNTTFMEDVSDVLCTLNDNHFYGFAPDPDTGKVPTAEPPYYQDLKVRKERQYRSLTKDIRKIDKEELKKDENYYLKLKKKDED